MSTARQLGIPAHFYCRPLTWKLRSDPAFNLKVDTTLANAVKLRNRELDAAFLGPIDYARECSEYRIVPGVAVSSNDATDTITIHFRDNISSIGRMAVDPSSTSEIILARIVLAEQFGIEPTLVPVMGSLEHMLQRADAALLIGNASLGQSALRESKLDLVEEWDSLTSLPYVHGFWCGRESDLSALEIRAIRSAVESGQAGMEEVMSEILADPAVAQSPFSVREYLDAFSYEFTKDAQKGLDEFIRYAYYHGILPDVADINFYSPQPVSPVDRSLSAN